MENNALLNTQQPSDADQIVQLTALVYLSEALAAQDYESCQELIDTAKGLGIDQGEISAVITEHLKAGIPNRLKAARLRSY